MGQDNLTFSTSYLCSGKGQPLIFIHGVGLDKQMWAEQVAQFSQDYLVITYDMLGHGESKNPSADGSLDDYVQQLFDLIEELQIKEKISLIGFSMGGLVARAFALKYQEKLHSLIILNSVFNRSQEQKKQILSRLEQTKEIGPSANVQAAIERWFSASYRQQNPEKMIGLKEKFQANDKLGYGVTYELFCKNDNFGESLLGNLKIPVLIATGELDVGSTPTMAYELAKKIPSSKVVIIPGQRHMMPVEAPYLTNQSIAAFLQESLLQQKTKETVGGN